MDELSDVAVVEALRRQLTVAATKQAVAASNLANAETPGYKTREVRFDDVLERGLGAANQPAATHPVHFQVTESTAAVQETAGLDPRRDGNNVELDRELLKMTRASGEFAQAQTALAAKFRLVRYAINEGQ